MHGQPIQNLTATEFNFFNAGNQTIISSDFAKAEPLGVSISGICFGAQINSDNPNASPAINAVSEHILDVEFEFLRPKESLTLIVWHDGDASFRGDLKSGKCREGRRGRTSFFAKYAIMMFIVLVYTFVLSMVLMALIAELAGNPLTFNHFFSVKEFRIAWLISGLTVMLPSVVAHILYTAKKYFLD